MESVKLGELGVLSASDIAIPAFIASVIGSAAGAAFVTGWQYRKQ